MTSSKKVSLSEVNQSIDTPNNNRFWQNLKAFLGPGALVAVGYKIGRASCRERV